MNIDLIIKLIKLANNNPNDNEANLSARKVCKLLATHTFNYQPTVAPPHSRTQNPSMNDVVNWMNNYQSRSRQQPSQPHYDPWVTWDEPPKTPYTTNNPTHPIREEPKRPKSYTDSYDATCIKCGKVVNVKHSRDPATFKCGTCAWLEDYPHVNR